VGKQRQSLIGCTKGDRVQRMSMDHCTDVRTGTIRLGMHDCLEVRPRRQVALLLVQCNRDDVLCEDIAQCLSLPLDVDGALVWPPDPRVTQCQVLMPEFGDDPARERHLLPRFSRTHPGEAADLSTAVTCHCPE